MSKRAIAAMVGVLGLGVGTAGAPVASASHMSAKVLHPEMCRGNNWHQFPFTLLHFSSKAACNKYFARGGLFPNLGGYNA